MCSISRSPNLSQLPLEHHFSNMQLLSESLSQRIVDDLKQLTVPTAVVVSGGSTPVPLYKAFAQQDHLFWSKIALVLSDERWVAHDHPKSNEKMIVENWLGKVKNVPQWCSLLTDSVESIEPAVPEIEARLQRLQLPFRWVILGMGDDGHIASLFPSQQPLYLSKSCLAVSSPGLSEQRISLTLDMLLNADKVILLISGKKKYEVFQQSLNNPDTIQCPVSSLWRQDQVSVELYCCK